MRFPKWLSLFTPKAGPKGDTQSRAASPGRLEEQWRTYHKEGKEGVLKPYRPVINSLIEQAQSEHKREAIRIVLDSSTETSSEFASIFGSVNLSLAGERWPQFDGKPMLPLCQINIADLPFTPIGLENILFLTLFMCNGEWLPASNRNGEGGFVLRAYKSIEGLVTIEKPSDEARASVYEFQHLKEVPIRFESFDDYPDWRSTLDDGMPLGSLLKKRLIELIPEIKDDRWILDTAVDFITDSLQHRECSKFGGWPSEIQGDPVHREEPENGRYVFQLCPEPEAGWMYGDCGSIVLSRGSGKYEGDWFGGITCY